MTCKPRAREGKGMSAGSFCRGSIRKSTLFRPRDYGRTAFAADAEVYYSGDIDPEGIGIADSCLYDRYLIAT